MGWQVTAFNLPDAWAFTKGEGVVIAVLDCGCDLTHTDLRNNLLEGMNFVQPGNPPNDTLGHGTHVTGVLVAENNDIGMVGIAPNAKVRPVKVLDDQGNGNMSIVAQGIRWAADQGCDFISMSLGSPLPVAQVRKAIQYAASKGTITLCAAGNLGKSTEVLYPAAYPETIAVGAITQELRRADFSNTGKNLDFMAPGVDIYSTVPKNWYAKMSGTSMAQPFVCGVAALVKSYVVVQKKRSDVTLTKAQDYVDLLKQYTIPVTNGNYDDPTFYEGFGIIDPRTFLQSIKR